MFKKNVKNVISDGYAVRDVKTMVEGVEQIFSQRDPYDFDFSRITWSNLN